MTIVTTAEQTLCQDLIRHYTSVWPLTGVQVLRWNAGPVQELPPGFCVVAGRHPARACWIYATCGMESEKEVQPIELHLFSPVATEAHVELLTVIAHYHRTGAPLGLGHTVNFGRPWLPGSLCTHGLISLPYLDGPKLERYEATRCLWLVPVTESEVAYKKANGLEALEQKFEQAQFNYLDPKRPPVV
jgi:hypothetical protein